MKNTYTIEESNRIVEEYLWCVKAVMKQNSALIDAARLDRDDVYQDLSIRLIRAVGSYDPEKSELKKHIFHQLRYELLSCARPHRTTGITGAPKGFHRGEIASLDAFASEDISAAGLLTENSLPEESLAA